LSAVIDASDRRFISRPWTAAVDPAVTDDLTKGVQVGDAWFNTATGNIFDAIAVTAGAAVWRHRPRHWQSGAAAAVTGTTAETALATITVPANALGANGALHIQTVRSFNNDASGKTSRVRYSSISGTEYRLTADANTAGISDYLMISNANATNAQVGGPPSTGAGLGVGTHTTSAVDTTAATTLVITGQLTDGADNITLRHYKVTLTRPDIGP
jgi:hypothetical protein